MKNKIEEVKKEIFSKSNLVKNLKDIENLRVEYLGRKGTLTLLLRTLGTLSPEERPKIGQLLNQTKRDIEKLLDIKATEIEKIEKNKKLHEESVDITLPGRKHERGGTHPITLVLKKIEEIFLSLGFKIEEGPEVELDYYNFEALNIPKDHPARDDQDSFYINREILLRTHTSPVEIRVMEKQQPPVRMITIGRCYRRDAADSTHSPMFHQIEGLYVDKGVTFSELKGVLEYFACRFFTIRPSCFSFRDSL